MSRKGYSLYDWERFAIIEAYLGGEKVSAIAAEFGVRDQYPGILAKRRGYPIRVGHRPPISKHLVNACVS
jgi:hypothetical protein